MEEIYKDILSLVNSITQLPETTYEFKKNSTEENIDKIVKVIDKCENKFLKVKDEIVKMISETEIENENKLEQEQNIEIQAVLTDKGFLIKE